MNPTSHDIAAVLFDLDGTLLDTAPDMVGALNQLRRDEGLAALPYLGVRPLVSHGATALVKLGFPNVNDQEFGELRSRFLAIYKDCLSVETRPYEGVTEVLSHLEDNGIPWGVVTNKPTLLTEALLDDLSLRARAGAIVCGDTLSVRKPHPGPLLHAAEKLGISPARCIYVGDAERDVLSACAAGMRVFVALYGYISADERPLDWPATGWLDQPLAMMPLIQFPSNMGSRF